MELPGGQDLGQPIPHLLCKRCLVQIIGKHDVKPCRVVLPFLAAAVALIVNIADLPAPGRLGVLVDIELLIQHQSRCRVVALQLEARAVLAAHSLVVNRSNSIVTPHAPAKLTRCSRLRLYKYESVGKATAFSWMVVSTMLPLFSYPLNSILIWFARETLNFSASLKNYFFCNAPMIVMPPE